MTYRERREAKADRYREWADKREAKATADFKKVDDIASVIPFGQPILVGHHSEGRARRDQDRIYSGMSRGVENLNKAETFRGRADTIESQLERSIYSDDEDAVEKLEERIEALETERTAIVKFNATVRKGSPDYTLLTRKQAADLVVNVRHGFDRAGQFPAYVTTNLSGNINRNKKRLEALRRVQYQPKNQCPNHPAFEADYCPGCGTDKRS